MLSHVFALTGFLLLRRDRPAWPRPIKLSAVWLPIAGLLAAANLLFIVVGGFIKADEYGYGWDKTRVGLIVLGVSLLFWMFRHLVQDRTGLRIREEVPQTPTEAAAVPTATASAT
jgi:amino acid transporter